MAISLDRTAKGVVVVKQTDDYDETGEGMRATLFPEGLLVEGAVTQPAMFAWLIDMETLLAAWHEQNEKIGH